MLLRSVRLVESPRRSFSLLNLSLQTSLLSVESLPEHLFVQNWLNAHDPSTQRWITSGRRNGPFWQWAKSTGLINLQFDQGWLPRTEQEQRLRSFLVYAYQSTQRPAVTRALLSNLSCVQAVNGVGSRTIWDRARRFRSFAKCPYARPMA